jgi:predicted small lipoprotein YifL
MKKIILGVLITFCLLAACGQKGNLYLPPSPITPAPTVPTK